MSLPGIMCESLVQLVPGIMPSGSGVHELPPHLLGSSRKGAFGDLFRNKL